MDDPPDQPSRAGTTGWSVSDVEGPSTTPKKATRRRRQASGAGATSTAKKKRASSASSRRRATSKRKPKTKPATKPRAASETKPKRKTTARRRAASESKPRKKTTARRRATAKPKTTTSRRRTSTRPKKTTTRRRARPKGGLADLIAEILARKSSGESSPVLGPILENLANGLGLSSDASQSVVAFVLKKLLAGHTAAGKGRGSESAGLLERLQSGQPVDKQYVISTGMAQELAQQSGLDPDVAAASLAKVLGQLRGTGLIPA